RTAWPIRNSRDARGALCRASPPPLAEADFVARDLAGGASLPCRGRARLLPALLQPAAELPQLLSPPLHRLFTKDVLRDVPRGPDDARRRGGAQGDRRRGVRRGQCSAER